MKAIIDRIEGNTAVLLIGEEGKDKLNMPLGLLPVGCKEGDVLSISIELDPEATSQAKERVSGLMDKLKKKGKADTGTIQNPGT
jgi:hypothetical protein